MANIAIQASVATATVPFGATPYKPVSLFDALGVGGAVAVTAGSRIARYFHLRGELGGALFSGGAGLGNGWSLSFELYAAAMTAPERAGLYVEIGGGARSLAFTSNSAFGTRIAGEGVIGVGMHFKGGWQRIVPKLDAFVGSFGAGDAHVLFMLNVLGLVEVARGRT